MIPSILARQIRRGVEDFLQTTFQVTTPRFHGVVERLMAEDGGVFQGPYVSVDLPFRRGRRGPGFFPELPLPFHPYLHQELAFERLAGERARSTLIATGTGSGKTECFLYPVLAHCVRHAGRPGIKAILIYPMNALATDQAGRIARLVHETPALKGKVRVGLYVGDKPERPAKAMGPDTVITDRDTLRLDPPDVLLTNYKMLDYLLVRPRDQQIWAANGPETLRYLVVDELHTFDGAQGTDLACLVRRLKARLGTPEGHLCCVGTSATLGSGEEREDLLRYAAHVFGEPFDAEAVVGEHRVSAGEFLENVLVEAVAVPGPDREAELDPEGYEGVEAYLAAQVRLWFGPEAADAVPGSPGWPVALARRLKGHVFFQNLLKVLRGRVRPYDEVLFDLERAMPWLRRGEGRYGELLLDSLLALVSAARVRTDSGGLAPFLHVRVQSWVRELRRMVATVGPTPRLVFSHDLSEEEARVCLPVVNCRDCGATGWAGLKRDHQPVVLGGLDEFYPAFFADPPHRWVRFFFPEEPGNEGLRSGEWRSLCGRCLHLAPEGAADCPSCGAGDLVPVFEPDTTEKRKDRTVGSKACPFCDSPDGLTVVGSRAASLASVMISQVFASGFNDDKKLLAFSDSVQDAAHRAGFFAARTYRFNLRGALQRLVEAEADGRTLAELPARFARYWGERLGPEAFVATFLPPDLEWLEEVDHLRKHGRVPEGGTLLDDLNRRLTWEIATEYGLRARVGRTLEKTGSSIARPDPERLERAAAEFLETLRNEDGTLAGLDRTAALRLLAGILRQLRVRGGILLDVLEGYVEARGNPYRLSKIPWMPWVSARRSRPRFVSRKGTAGFDA
ncbi:MAG: DEAD/DEAH box helicase, partial [Candidatus Dadabacteria bacterium]